MSTVLPDVIAITALRLSGNGGGEEGFRADVYDDATGIPMQGPKGNPTVGYGCKVIGWSKQFAYDVMKLQLQAFKISLMAFDWFNKIDPVRQSVFLDLAFNMGVSGLLHYPHMIAFASAGDWVDAAKECTSTTPGVQARYANLARILETGAV